MFTLRDYQQQASDAGVEFFNDKKNKKKPVIVIPTGGGKSLVIADIVKNLHGNTLVFQPSKELLEQNLGKYRWYGEDAQVYSASMNTKEIGRVTFATIGSVKNKPELFQDFKYCIIDECHLVPPQSGSMYMKFLDELNIKVLGLTATPIRLKTYGFPDKHSKLNMLDRQTPKTFNSYIHVTQISELVDRGFFAKTRYYSFDFNKSTLRVNSSGAEYTERSVDQALAQQGVITRAKKIAQGALDKGRKHVLVFTQSVDDAKMVVAGKKDWAYVHATTPAKERAEIVEKFKGGQIKVVANVGIFTVGFDHPQLDTIILARPTLSLALYYQMIGRGVRPHPEKEDCVIVDLVGNHNSFGRVEDLVIENRGHGWAIWNGDRQLTNVPMSPIDLQQTQAFA